MNERPRRIWPALLAGALFSLMMCAVLVVARAAVTQSNGPWTDFAEGTMANCNANAINSAVTCGGTQGVASRGYNALSLTFYYTRSAGTGWSCTFETCEEGDGASDCTDATDWAALSIQQVTPGVITLTPGVITRSISASDQLSWTTGVNFNRFRLKNCQASGPADANDKFKAVYRLNWLPAF